MEITLSYIWVGSLYFPNTCVIYVSISANRIICPFTDNFQQRTIKSNVFITRFNICWKQRQNMLGSLPAKSTSLAAPRALSSVYYTVQFPKSIWQCYICILTSLFSSYWTSLNPSKHPVWCCGQRGRELHSTLLKDGSGCSVPVGYYTVLCTSEALS